MRAECCGKPVRFTVKLFLSRSAGNALFCPSRPIRHGLEKSCHVSTMVNCKLLSASGFLSGVWALSGTGIIPLVGIVAVVADAIYGQHPPDISCMND